MAYARGEVAESEKLLAAACVAGDLHADWASLGRLRARHSDLPGAREAFERAHVLNPDDTPAARALAHVLVELGEPELAYRTLQAQHRRAPAAAGLTCDLAVTAELTQRPQEALTLLGTLLAAAPDSAQARLQRAQLYSRRHCHAEALADYTALSRSAPRDVRAWHGQAECLRQTGESAAALAACERALACEASHVPSLLCKAVVLATGGETAAAQICFDQAHRLDPQAVARYGGGTSARAEPPDARAVHLYSAFEALKQYRWADYAALVARAGEYFADPEMAPSDLSVAFPALYLPLSPRAASAAHIAVSRGYAGLPAAHRLTGPGRRLRIGYITTKFRDHPAMLLTAGMFAAHDRNRHSVHGYALNADDGGVERRRVESEFDAFTDLSRDDDDCVAQRIADDGIDILIDLNGYADEGRPGVLARQPAALQLCFLGHTHSLFAPWIAYRVTDHVSEPVDWGFALREARAFMPGSVFPYGARLPRNATVTRVALGLPDDGFVLCAFTRPEKILPQCFGMWLAIMRKVPHAVLWLLAAGAGADRLLRAHAESAGIDPARLIFSPRVTHDAHLVRLQAADLYLDTTPFNAHTTGLDALHAGLPVVTLKGDAWASRIGASLLTSVGLTALVASTPADYVARAVEFAQHPESLLRLRTALRETITGRAPFAAERAAHRLDAAFEHMWARHRAGLPPADFDIPS